MRNASKKGNRLIVLLLGRIVTHFPDVVRVEWVAHHTRVIGVGLTVKSARVGHAVIVSYFW